MYLKITYYSRLYKREITDLACGEVAFHRTESGDVVATYKCGGHGRAVEVKNIRTIEPVRE